MKKIIILTTTMLSGLLFLNSCNTRNTSFEENLPLPKMTILNSKGQAFNNDSLKLTLKSAKKTSVFSLLLDGDNQPKKVTVTVVNGNGYFSIDGKTGSEFDLNNGLHAVSYVPSSVSGSTLINFELKTYTGRMASDKFEIVTYANLPPVAQLEVTKNNIYSGLQYELDASKSVDGDHFSGGYIVDYEFSINGKKIHRQESILDWVFGEAGTYSLSLTVTDNDGDKATKNLGAYKID